MYYTLQHKSNFTSRWLNFCVGSVFYHFQSKWLNFHFLKEGTRPEVRGRRLNFCTNFSDFHQKLHSAFHQCQCRDYWKVFLWLLFPFSEARNIYLFKRKTCPTTSVSPSLESSWGGSNCFSGKPGKRCIYYSATWQRKKSRFPIYCISRHIQKTFILNNWMLGMRAML